MHQAILVAVPGSGGGATLAVVTRDRQRCGRTGEARAAAFLAAHGLTILARNVRGPAGEIDVVALDGETVVFCEVRTRRSRGQGGALESVTPAKQRQVVRVAAWFLTRHPELASRPVRFDVVAIDVYADHAVIDHVADAFGAA
jgi:putative endonuclease